MVEMENVYERMGRNEEKVFSLDRRVQILEEDRKALNDMSINMQLLTQMYKQQTELNNKQSEQIDKVNDNLTEMSKSLVHINNNQEIVNKELKEQGEELKAHGERLKEIEEDKAVSGFFVKTGKVIFAGIVLGVIAYVLKVTTGINFSF